MVIAPSSIATGVSPGSTTIAASTSPDAETLDELERAVDAEL
jgi:hypothetical protein